MVRIGSRTPFCISGPFAPFDDRFIDFSDGGHGKLSGAELRGQIRVKHPFSRILRRAVATELGVFDLSRSVSALGALHNFLRGLRSFPCQTDNDPLLVLSDKRRPICLPAFVARLYRFRVKSAD